MQKLIVTAFAVWFGVLCGFQSIYATGQIAAETSAVVKIQAIPNGVQLNKIRSSQSTEKIRIVLDLSDLPAYSVVMQEDSKRLTITLANTELGDVLPVLAFNDKLVKRVLTVPGNDQSVKMVIDLAYLAHYEVFHLSNPHRLVIDFWKIYEQKTEKILNDSLRYTVLHKGTVDGPLAINILDYDLNSTSMKLEHVLAKDIVPGTETLSSMAARYNALAAVNGTYFSPTGELLGLAVADGQIVQTPIEGRTAFAITNTRGILIDQVSYTGELTFSSGQRKCPIQAVNRERGQDELVVYTPVYGKTTQTNNYGTEFTVVDGVVSQLGFGNAIIPANGYVISAHGSSQQLLSTLKVGDVVELHHQFNPNWSSINLAIGAGPQLIKNGLIYLTTKTEGFGSDVTGGRAPRTALGVDARGHLLLVTVDGRQSGYSIGMTLLELAQQMQALGAINAMNLDGGGSTEMVVAGKIVNHPSDGHERRVGDALAFVPMGGE